MRVFIDTNVILDVLMKRDPYYSDSAAVLMLCGSGVTGCILACQTTDIFHVVQRSGLDATSTKAIIKTLIENLKVVDATAADVQNALASEMKDFEDAFFASAAARSKARYIITRNEKDFRLSPVPAISPKAFLEI